MLIEFLSKDPVYFFRYLIIVIISIVVHELGHGLIAINQGDDTPIKKGHITCNPIVHLGWSSTIFLVIAGMAWGRMPVDPNKFRNPRWSDIFVSAAGPLANLILGIIFLSLLKLKLILSWHFLSSQFLYLAAYINFSLCFFNLIPLPPLDGFNIVSQFFLKLRGIENSSLSLFSLAIIYTTGIGSFVFILSQNIIKTIV